MIRLFDGHGRLDESLPLGAMYVSVALPIRQMLRNFESGYGWDTTGFGLVNSGLRFGADELACLVSLD
jgi:hypothetical protein